LLQWQLGKFHRRDSHPLEWQLASLHSKDLLHPLVYAIMKLL